MILIVIYIEEFEPNDPLVYPERCSFYFASKLIDRVIFHSVFFKQFGSNCSTDELAVIVVVNKDNLHHTSYAAMWLNIS